MRANQFVTGYVSQSVKVESVLTDYDRAVMEGGHSLDKPKSALREAVSVDEAFNNPYKTKSEKSEYGDLDMLAKLPDGSNLSIMFNKQQDEDGKEVVQVEFYRNNSQEVTGEGDAQRIFSTVLASIQKYIKKYKPSKLSFSASKATDSTIHYEPDQPHPNPESRAKLYDRLVQRYARAWGYRAFRADTGDLVIYELSRLQPAVAENFADGKVKGKSSPGRVKRSGASCDGSVSELRSKAKNASGERAKMYHWCANMKSGRAKNESEMLEDLNVIWKDVLEAGIFRGYPCTKDCSGHEAGYRWSDDRDITDPNECPYSNNSFWEGCLAHTDEQE